MLNQPISSAMMNRMFGFLVICFHFVRHVFLLYGCKEPGETTMPTGTAKDDRPPNKSVVEIMRVDFSQIACTSVQIHLLTLASSEIS